MWGLPGESLVRHTEGRSGATAHGYCHLSPGSIPTAHGTLHKPLRATRYTAGTTAYGSTFNTAYQTPILANKIYSWDGGWNEAQKWKHVL